MTDAPELIWADQDNLTWVEANPDEAMKDCEAVYVRRDLCASGQQVRALEWYDCADGSSHDHDCQYEVEQDGKQWRLVRASTGPGGYLSHHQYRQGAKEAAQADYERRILSALTPAPQPEGQDEVQCDTCAGNGEIVTDWDGYLRPPEGAPADHAVADCPDCAGSGWTPAPDAAQTEAVPALVEKLRQRALAIRSLRRQTKTDIYDAELDEAAAAALAGQVTHPAAPAPGIAEADIEIMARAMCESDMADFDAPSSQHTANGQDPEDQREYWRDKARIALRALANGGSDAS